MKHNKKHLTLFCNVVKERHRFRRTIYKPAFKTCYYPKTWDSIHPSFQISRAPGPVQDTGLSALPVPVGVVGAGWEGVSYQKHPEHEHPLFSRHRRREGWRRGGSVPWGVAPPGPLPVGTRQPTSQRPLPSPRSEPHALSGFSRRPPHWDPTHSWPVTNPFTGQSIHTAE